MSADRVSELFQLHAAVQRKALGTEVLRTHVRLPLASGTWLLSTVSVCSFLAPRGEQVRSCRSVPNVKSCADTCVPSFSTPAPHNKRKEGHCCRQTHEFELAVTMCWELDGEHGETLHPTQVPLQGVTTELNSYSVPTRSLEGVKCSVSELNVVRAQQKVLEYPRWQT